MVGDLFSSQSSNPIRSIALSRDLLQIADLIERCFPIHEDPDGQTYIREMRNAARDMQYLGWINRIAELGNTKPAGFVWEEGGKIIGNLSLIPFRDKGRSIHLIANVAVHPDHRRKGIGRTLTQHALGALRRYGERETWLQVRNDNVPAIDLYHSLGFKDQVTRSTWQVRPFEFQSGYKPQAQKLRKWHRRPRDWEKQKDWLNRAYPVRIRWNLPLNLDRLAPGIPQRIINEMDGVKLGQWSFLLDDDCQGVIALQKTKAFANNLWIAFPEDKEEALLPGALSSLLLLMPQKHPLSIDYPEGRFSSQFLELGFTHFRTLIWMSCRL